MIQEPLAAAGYTARSLTFVARKQSRRLPRFRVREACFDLGHRVVRADVYTPADGRPRRGVVLFLHGMTAHGNRDARVVDFCRHLTAFGHAIVAPQFDEIAGFSADISIVDDLERTVLAVADDRELSATGAGVGLISASFTALFCLIAACRPALRDRVPALCLIGGIYSADALQGIICASAENPFVRDVLFLNFLDRSVPRPPGLERALRVALEDNSLARAIPELPACLAALEAEDRALFLRLRHDADFRSVHAKPIADYFSAGLAAALRDRGALRARVLLIHGERDPVLPSSESVRLHQDLCSLGVRSHLDLTPLIGHNDAVALRLSLCAPVLRLAVSFARFFQEVGR